jgi:hypothetical protein
MSLMGQRRSANFRSPKECRKFLHRRLFRIAPSSVDKVAKPGPGRCSDGVLWFVHAVGIFYRSIRRSSPFSMGEIC